MNLISEAFKDYGEPFDTEFKYSRARMFSSTTPPWFDQYLPQTGGKITRSKFG